jgi:hypothetical protein
MPKTMLNQNVNASGLLEILQKRSQKAFFAG